jgi:hypothetical protein
VKFADFLIRLKMSHDDEPSVFPKRVGICCSTSTAQADSYSGFARVRDDKALIEKMSVIPNERNVCHPERM